MMGDYGVRDNREPINLLRGWPHRSLLPVDLIKEATQAVLSDLSVAYDGLLYGPDPGYEPCREAIAEWLTSFYQTGVPASAARICVTGGASQNLGCMLNAFTDPSYTRNVWIIAPAYMLAFPIFADAGFGAKMRAVPEDDEGLDIEFLRREMEKSEQDAKRNGSSVPAYKPGRKLYKHVVYCVPTFSNPSSKTMSLARRSALVRLARDFDALVSADDVYDFLQWPADMAARNPGAMHQSYLPRLVDIDRELDGGTDRQGADGFGNACSNGTLSKIAGPGIRVGWVEGSEKFAYGVSQTGTSRSGGAPSQLTSTYMTRLIKSGQIQHHIETVLRPAYAKRYYAVLEAIKTHLQPLGFAMPQPDRERVGGYFVWLTLPEGLNADELAKRCRQDENLIIAPGKIFEVPGDSSVRFERSVRLCFAWEDLAKLTEAVRRIERVAGQLLHHSAAPDKNTRAGLAGSSDADLQTYK